MASGKISAAVFGLALVMRLTNAPLVFAGAVPRLSPLDELYHWKRITFSATHFPAALEFDRDRGERGLFCPWPPLYDVACAAVSRLFGGRTAAEVLWRVIWIPPLIGAAAAALAAWLIAKQFGARAAIAGGIALATSPFIVTQSSIGDIDHHYLEWPLAFAIIAGTCLILRGGSWVPMTIAMTLAMFVQSALLVACGIAFVILFFLTDGRAAAIAFGTLTMIIAIYRVTRPANFPDSPWFLGWPYVALFAAAAVALLLRSRPALAIAAGAALALTYPSAIATGSHFFGGERWLETIAEFQPLWKGTAEDWLSHAAGLSIGAILVWDLARRALKTRDAIVGTIALFAIVYLSLAISSRRFESTAIPLLALAGAVDAAMILRRNAAMITGAAVALIPAVQLALWMTHPLPPIVPSEEPWIRAAGFLQRQPPGRVLGMWTLGHALDVVGERPVIVDNFGTMPDPIAFDRAHDALMVVDEASLARYCQGAGVRYIVIENPMRNFIEVAQILGIDPQAFVVRDRHGRPIRITRLAQATWWWRAYFSRGAPLPQQGMFGRAFTRFRLVYADPQIVLDRTPFRGPALMSWEYVGGG
jgi:asparagine N-glycosylation enzyme membrane subunit Stt3